MNRTLLLVPLLAACAAHDPMPGTPTSRGRVADRSGWIAPTRSEEECQAVAANGPSLPTAVVTPPQPAKIVFPPFDGVPRSQRGVLIDVRLFVGLHGEVVPDSTQLTPAIASPGYDRRFRASLARTSFHPGVLEGCAVPAWAHLEVTLPVSGS